jgi:hypothetical protein
MAVSIASTAFPPLFKTSRIALVTLGWEDEAMALRAFAACFGPCSAFCAQVSPVVSMKHTIMKRITPFLKLLNRIHSLHCGFFYSTYKFDPSASSELGERMVVAIQELNL